MPFHCVYLILLGLLVTSTFSKTIKVLTTEEDLSKFKDGSGARLKNPPVVELVDVTVCLRFYEFVLVKKKHLISSMLSSSSPILVIGDHYPKWIGFQSRWTKVASNIDWPIMTWNHICWSFDSETSTNRMVSNGDAALEEIDENLLKHPKVIPPEFLGTLFIMRKSYPDPINVQFRSMFGKMTDVNIWNYSMSIDEMKSWTNCVDIKVGNVVNWETAQWRMEGVGEERIAMEEICQSVNELALFTSPRRDFETSVKFCSNLGGNLAVADNSRNGRAMMELIMNREGECDKLDTTWAGYTDIDEEGNFINVVTGEDMVWKNWKTNQPNGGTEQNCVTVASSEAGQFHDTRCAAKLCTICQFGPRAKKLNLRGSCPEENLDLDYQLLNVMRQKRYVIRGMRSTELVWNMGSSSWNFINLRTKKVIAYNNDTDDYPLGTYKWIFTDGGCYDNNGGKYRKMNLNSCGENEFSCLDGQCIDGSLRCDLGYHCKDYSDEENCTIFTTPNYDKNSPPPILIHENEKHKMTLLKVSVDIIEILDIDEIDSKINIKFELTVTWNDARIYFKTLQNEEENLQRQ